MSGKLQSVLLFFIFALTFFENGMAAEYFLAPNGSNSNSGTMTSPWFDLNFVLNKSANNGIDARVKPGDTLYLRGGVYNVSLMTKPSLKQGPMMVLNTSPNSARITVKSYPGEWAILDGMGSTKILEAGVQTYNITFENFEIRNGFGVEGPGFAFGSAWGRATIVNGVFRNLYFHDNIHTDYNQNPGGLLLSGDNCVIEYCTFENNGTPGSSHHNSANLILYNSYNGPQNGTVLGGMDLYPRKNNIIRYNKFIGSGASIKDKGENNFVNMLPGADPYVDRHPEWSNEIHHNVIIGALSAGYYLHQDFVKVHHNLFVDCAKGVFYDGYQLGAVPLIWEAEIFNNTFVRTVGADIQFDESLNSSSQHGGYADKLYNNLSVSPKKTMISLFSGGWKSSPPTWPMVADHNGMDSSTGKPVGFYAGVGKTLAQWQALALGGNDFSAPVSLNVDYTLSAGARAIGAGRNGVDLGAFPSGAPSWYNQAGHAGLKTQMSPPKAPENLKVN